MGLAGGEQGRCIVDCALNVIASSQRITRIGKAELKIHHEQGWPFAKTDIPLPISRLCKLIHSASSKRSHAL